MIRAGKHRSSAGSALVAVAGLWLFAFAAAARTESGTSPPSLVLIVIDTLRADAVSAYGSVRDTTPTLDALAGEGLLYDHAYAPSPWTLPSHATLLSGLGVDQHRVGFPGRTVVPEDIVMLAERLQAAGYDTAGYSENPIVAEAFGLFQGFSRYDVNVYGQPEINLPVLVRKWLRKRDRSRPFFLFVNLVDPHFPYQAREENPFLPPGTTPSDIRNRWPNTRKSLCSGLPTQGEIAIMRGLYLGDVAAADRKVGGILRDVERFNGDAAVVTVVTSDHGEAFGERQLMGHLYSLNRAVLHVPLIVHGLAGIEPARIDATVELSDIAVSMLQWAGVAADEELRGRVLPEKNVSRRETRQIFAAYTDAIADGAQPANRDEMRLLCRKEQPVFGGMASLVQYPFKLHWFEHYPAELYDVSWDPGEKSDLAPQRPDLVEEMTAELQPFVEATRLKNSEIAEPVSDRVIDTLRSLGYID